LSQVMPGGGSDESREIEVNNGMPLQQRAPGSQLRNGSITVRQCLKLTHLWLFVIWSKNRLCLNYKDKNFVTTCLSINFLGFHFEYL
jgi:hypothetical protein